MCDLMLLQEIRRSCRFRRARWLRYYKHECQFEIIAFSFTVRRSDCSEGKGNIVCSPWPYKGSAWILKKVGGTRQQLDKREERWQQWENKREREGRCRKGERVRTHTARKACISWAALTMDPSQTRWMAVRNACGSIEETRTQVVICLTLRNIHLESICWNLSTSA